MPAITEETLLRSGITAADEAAPTEAQGIADLTGSPFATVGCKVEGTSPSFTITPLLWNDTLGVYLQGDAATITANTELNIAVNGCTDFYMLVSAVSGDGASLDITVKPALL